MLAVLVIAVLVLLGIGSLVGVGKPFEPMLEALGIIGFFITLIITGPVPALLTLFDITDAQLKTWTIALLIPYWMILGMIAGHFRWRKRDSSFPPMVIRFGAWLREKYGMESEQAALFKREIRNFRIVIVALAAALAMLFLMVAPPPPFADRGRRSIGIKIANNLRQLKQAKAMLASNENLPPDYTPTAAQLVKFLSYPPSPTNFLNHPDGPVRYVINAIDTPPYAVLEADWRIPRKGWRQGYTLTNGTVIKPW